MADRSAADPTAVEPTVDVIIAVHSAARPIRRAVSSVLDGTREPVRVSVVCHNIGVDEIRANLAEVADDPRVRLLHLADGIPSPAGPFNHGLDAATAPFTAMLDSDDTLERGAIDSWMTLQRRDNADAVIQRFAFATGSPVRTPPARPFRTARLDGTRDRLAYRTRQHGLVSRERFGDVRLTPGLRTGEDVEQGLRIWFSGASISFDRSGPGYLIHVDEDDRTSASSKPVAEDFAFLDAVVDAAWFHALGPRQRESIAVKLLRTHVLDAAESRLGVDGLSAVDLDALRVVVRRILDASPTAVGVLGRRDGRIVQALAEGRADSIALDLARHRQYWRLGNVVAYAPWRTLAREAPLRFLAALALTR